MLDSERKRVDAEHDKCLSFSDYLGLIKRCYGIAKEGQQSPNAGAIGKSPSVTN